MRRYGELLRPSRTDPAAAPAWVVTYADFMTLLLCLFVAILSMSTITKGNFDRAFGSLKVTFGGAGAEDSVLSGGTMLEQELFGIAPALNDDERETQKQMETRGVCLSRMQRGHSLIIGGKNMFERGTDVLSGEAELIAARLAEVLASSRHHVVVRGHAAGETPKKESSDIRDLSYRRAAGIAQILEEGGVAPNRITVVAMGDADPLLEHSYSESRRALNRRVEIEIIEQETPDPVQPAFAKKG